jgi:hypothetical protein
LRRRVGRGRIDGDMSGGRWRRSLSIIAVIVAAAAASWWLLHPRPTDEDLILALVAKAAHGVETKDKDEIMECVAKDYRDDSGLSRLDIFRLALHWERSPEQVAIVIDEYELSTNAPSATGRFDVQLDFQEAGRHEPPLRLPLVVEFEKQRQRWRRVWLVKSVSGHGIEGNLEGLY